MTLLDSRVQSSIWTLEQSTSAPDEAKYSDIENSFRDISGLRLDPAQGQIFVRRDGKRIPVYLEGGGIQSAVNLLFEIKSEPEKEFIFGIEEPEAHSHPEIQRRLFVAQKVLSGNNQMFITTHSTIFVDSADLTNTWIAKIVEGETKIARISELKEVLDELGSKPRDIFFSDRILFVEGKTEKIVIPVFARKLNIDMMLTAIVPVEGKEGARRHLKIWVETAHNALPLFLILDKDGQEEAEKLVKEGLLSSREYPVWQNGSIESYYPLSVLRTALDALNLRYKLELNVGELIDKIKEGSLTPDKIEIGQKAKLLDKSFRVALAEEVAPLITKCEERISNEVNRVLERVVSL